TRGHCFLKCLSGHWIHLSLCPDKPIRAGFSGSVTPCSVSTLAGRHDDRALISLMRLPANTPYVSCTIVLLRLSTCSLINLSQKTEVSFTVPMRPLTPKDRGQCQKQSLLRLHNHC